MKSSETKAERPGLLARLLREAGYRDTAPRRAVVRAIEEADGEQSPEALWRAAQRIHPGIGRATVYRTLELLTGLGAVRPLIAAEGGRRYPVAVGGHHHLVCSGCGTVVEFDECAEGEVARRVARRQGFAIQGHLLEIYGTCGDCRVTGEVRT